MATGFLELADIGTAGRLHADPPDARLAAREARSGTARMRPDTPFAIRGCVLTPDEALEDHHVIVAGAVIQDVVGPAPAGMPVLVSDGVILPGLIDLPAHPEYNVFPARAPPRLHPHR